MKDEMKRKIVILGGTCKKHRLVFSGVDWKGRI